MLRDYMICFFSFRTYYEKQILVPVPKTGLYPKKLVYKFGPNAKGWQNTNVAPISSTISKMSRPNNADKTTKQFKPGPLSTNVAASNVPFPMRPAGITSFVSALAMENGRMESAAAASSMLAKADSAAVVAAASGLMSLADVASRQLAADAEENDNQKAEESIDVDGHSETGECISAIEQTLVDEDDGDDEDAFSQMDGEDGEECDRDTPPALVD